MRGEDTEKRVSGNLAHVGLSYVCESNSPAKYMPHEDFFPYQPITKEGLGIKKTLNIFGINDREQK